MTTVDSKTGYYICPMFNDPCRHCSIEKDTRPYTKIKKSTAGAFFEPAGIGRTIAVIGEFCNNDGNHLVQDLQYCPSRWGLHRGTDKETLAAPIGRLAGAVVTRAKKKAKVGRPKKSTKKKKPAKRNTTKKRSKSRRPKRKPRITLGKKKGVKSRGKGKVKSGTQSRKKAVSKPKTRKIQPR